MAPARRQFDKLPLAVAAAVLETLDAIADNPRRLGKRLVLEHEGHWSARRGPNRLDRAEPRREQNESPAGLGKPVVDALAASPVDVIAACPESLDEAVEDGRAPDPRNVLHGHDVRVNGEREPTELAQQRPLILLGGVAAAPVR